MITKPTYGVSNLWLHNEGKDAETNGGMSNSFFICLESSCPFFPSLWLSCYSASRLRSLVPWPALNRWGMFGTTPWHAVRLNWARSTRLYKHTHTYRTYTHPLLSLDCFLSILKEPLVPHPLHLSQVGVSGLECASGLSPGLADYLPHPPSW